MINAFALNLNVVKRQTDGLTHADSLLQTPFRANCMNWVIGHIAANQNRILGFLGEEPVLAEHERARYLTDSEPIAAADERVLSLETLLAALERSQERIAAGLRRATAEDLQKEVQVGQRTTTVGQRIFFLYFHETYHVGQLELLRQLAGKNDKVI